MITIDDFRKLEIKVGKVVEATLHPNADKLLLLKIDIGGEVRQVVSGIREHYKPEELVGKSVIVLCNLEPAKFRGVESQGMILAASNEGKLGLLGVDKDLPAGSKIS